MHSNRSTWSVFVIGFLLGTILCLGWSRCAGAASLAPVTVLLEEASLPAPALPGVVPDDTLTALTATQSAGEDGGAAAQGEPARITGLTYTTDGGRAQVRLTLSARLLSVQPRRDGTSVLLDLYPVVTTAPSAEYPICDELISAVRLIRDGETATLQVDLRTLSPYSYTLTPDGLELVLQFDAVVQDVRFQGEAHSPQVVIAASGDVPYAVTEETDLHRLIIDIQGALPAPEVVSPLEVNHPAVTHVWAGPYGSGTRVVVDLGEEAGYHVVSTTAGLEIRLLPRVTAIWTEPYADRTRLILESNLPVGAAVTVAENRRQLQIEIPQGSSGLGSDVVTLEDDLVRQVALQPGASPGSLLVTVNLAVYWDHAVVSRDGEKQIILDVMRSPLYGRRIWIDAGHGWIPGGADDPGAIGGTYGTREKAVNLEVALALQQKLEAAGAIVYMTRTGDEGIDFRDRPALVNAVNPPVDLFISIHHNSAAASMARGTETYYWITNPRSRIVAQYVHAAVVEALGFPDRGVRQYGFWVIKETLVPSILVELGFLSNPDEEYLIAEPGRTVRTYPERAAQGIYQGVVNYYLQEIR